MSQKPKLIRRRRVPRREFNRNIGLLVRGQYYITMGLQLGEGGMLLTSPEQLAIGQSVVITFIIPGHTPDIVRATVRYLTPEGPGKPATYGAEFINLDFGSKRDIRNYVASQKTNTVTNV